MRFPQHTKPPSLSQSQQRDTQASADETVDRTRTFWNAFPCDGHELSDELRRYRYTKEAWLPRFIQDICGREDNIVEIGCGQGTDSLTFCSILPETGSYIGIDYSDISIANAARFASEQSGHLRVTPVYKVADARHLPFRDGSIAAVYSMGVLHHINETEAAIAEIFRVLAPGGRLYLGLYHRLSAKLLVAHALRVLQQLADVLFRTDRSMFRLLRRCRPAASGGTMLHECFGVPVLKSYTADGMRRLLHRYDVESLYSCGSASVGSRRFGYLLVATACKPMPQNDC